MKERIVTELGNGFYVVVNPHASNPRDSLQVLNQLQLNVLSKQLNGVINFDTLTENETIAFYNLEKRGVLNDKNVETNKYPKTLSIWLHVTDQCNMACTYCHVVKKDQHMHDAMLNDFADMLFRTAQNKGLREITLRLAGGEPVLRFASIHDWIEETRNRLASLDCSLKIAMLSGLASLPTQVVEFVKKPKNGISVSMDGIGEVQDKSRPLVNGEGSFEKVRKNIEKLKTNGVNPYILTVISDENIEGLVDFTKWLIDENLGFRYSFQKGGELNRLRVAQVLIECYDLIESAVLSGEYTEFHRHRLADLSTFNAQKTACGAGRNTCSVYLDGNIYMCQMQHGNTKPLGNVTDSNDLCEILVDRSEQNDFHDLDDTCKKCHLRANCSGGCPIDRQGGHNPNCSLFKEFLPRIHKIHGLKKLKKIIGEDKFYQKFYSNNAVNGNFNNLYRKNKMSQSILDKLRVISLSNLHSFLDAVKAMNSIGELEQYIRDITTVRNNLDDQSASLRGRKSYLETQISSAEANIAVANENIDLVLGDDDPENDHIAVGLQVEMDAAEKKIASAQAELDTILPQVAQFDEAVIKLNTKLQESNIKLETLKSLEDTTNAKEKAAKALSSIDFGDEPDTSGVESRLHQKAAVADNALQRSLGEVTASIGISSSLDMAKVKIEQRKKLLQQKKQGDATINIIT